MPSKQLRLEACILSLHNLLLACPVTALSVVAGSASLTHSALNVHELESVEAGDMDSELGHVFTTCWKILITGTASA